MEGGNSSDSGSGGIIDVTNMSSSFTAPSLHTSDTSDDTALSKRKCPFSVEKVWFTDTSTGVWLLQEEECDCEIPDEFLDVSLESAEQDDEAGQCSSDEDGLSEDREKEQSSAGKNEKEAASGKTEAEQPQLCGWVPPQCCLIPLPASPVGSDDEKEEPEEGEVRGAGCELSESELQRQHEKDLEVLFGYKPPPKVSLSEADGKEGYIGNEGGVFAVGNKEKALAAARGNRRSNSTDSGVASISPRSTEGDLEQRPNHNRTEMTATTEGTGQMTTNENETEHGDTCARSSGGEATSPSEVEGGVERNLTPKRSSEQLHLPVSRLRTPSEKLRKCSTFTGSPVICSELEELKEASKMVTLPFPPPPSTHNALDHTFILTSPTSHTLTHCSTQKDQTGDCEGEHERVSEKSSDISVSSATSGCSSVGSREPNEQVSTKNTFGKKTITYMTKLSKPTSHGTFAYKAGTGAPQVKKMTKKPPSKLKSLLPVSEQGLSSSVLPSQIKKPEMNWKVRGKDPQLPLGGPSRKTCAVRTSGLMQPGKKIVRKSSDPGPNIPKISKTFAKPAPPIKGASNPIGRLNVNGTQTQSKVAVTSKQNPQHLTTPTRPKGTTKPPNNAKSKRPTTSTVACTSKATNKTTQATVKSNADFSTSIVSSCSPSVQQSTPMRRVSHLNAAAARANTVVKTASKTVTKEESTSVQCEGGNDPTPCTPRSLAGSTPSRVCPKFSLSSIDSEAGSVHQPPTTAGETFTKDTEGRIRSSIESTPRSPRKKRRSFIPTPVRKENRGVIPLVYSADTKSQQDSLVSRKWPNDKLDSDVGCSPVVGRGKKACMPPLKTRRPLVVRNRMASGLGKKHAQKGQDGPLKPVNTYKCSSGGVGEDTEPLILAAKVIHSPVNQEDKPDSPHSAWSPIRRKRLAKEDACFQCTKRGFRNN